VVYEFLSKTFFCWFLYCSDILFLFSTLTLSQKYCAFLKPCLAGTDSINQVFYSNLVLNLQIQSNPTQAIKDLSSSNRGQLLNQVSSSFEESKPFEG